MSELFDIPESKSPRLAEWMKQHGIQAFPLAELPGFDSALKFVATKQVSEGGETEEQALRKLAATLGISTWEEQ